MVAIIEDKKDLLSDLCRRFGVRRLEVFGSANSDSFDPSKSDFDFLVEFLPQQDLGPWLRHYFRFREELAQLVGRSVDLVMANAVKNAYFRRELERTRKVLYAT